MRIPVAREGAPFIAVLALLLVLAVYWSIRQQAGFLRVVPPGLVALLLAFVVYFFRDPERQIPVESTAVVSPADGKVIEIRQTDGEGLLEGPGTRITIFLSVFNVHVQRAPVSGRVRSYEYHPGEYRVAWHDKASEENERAALTIGPPGSLVGVRQIAGLVARRIVTYPRPGDEVTKGDRIGLIRFGSRVDLLVPVDWSVAVEVGDRVTGGETVVAHTTGGGA